MNTKQLVFFVASCISAIGCDESITCNDIYLPRVRGTVVDEHGEGIVPDRVLLVGKETNECEIYPLGFEHEEGGQPSFQCFGAGDDLLIYRGDEVMDVVVPETQDPCGSDYPVLEIVWTPE